MDLTVYDMFKNPKCTYYGFTTHPDEYMIDSMDEAGFTFEIDGEKKTARQVKNIIKKNIKCTF